MNLLAAYMAVSISVDSIAKSDLPHQDVLRKSVGQEGDGEWGMVQGMECNHCFCITIPGHRDWEFDIRYFIIRSFFRQPFTSNPSWKKLFQIPVLTQFSFTKESNQQACYSDTFLIGQKSFFYQSVKHRKPCFIVCRQHDLYDYIIKQMKKPVKRCVTL